MMYFILVCEFCFLNLLHKEIQKKGKQDLEQRLNTPSPKKCVSRPSEKSEEIGEENIFFAGSPRATESSSPNPSTQRFVCLLKIFFHPSIKKKDCIFRKRFPRKAHPYHLTVIALRGHWKNLQI